MNVSENECELVGAIIGDGHIYRGFGKYLVGVTGHRTNDAEYLKHLCTLIELEWGIKKKPFFRGGGLRIVFQSKPIVERLLGFFELPFGAKKCYTVVIPSVLRNDWKYSRHVLRGLVDTDGSVFVSKKPGIDRYPSLEITTVSKELASQTRNILLSQGFRAANLRFSYSRLSTRPAYKVALFGWKNLLKWFNEIGFSNPVKREKARAILVEKYGNV
ncbi:hypothetical protein KKE06_02700 [Candidatus Micrarchaeota archaeon]|nr:hypothetical protein [Candidatus Micrarchaeota archaeon]MBU1930829.1 hypothetical protein [Candidatus Micrarchaeota archaeon]